MRVINPHGIERKRRLLTRREHAASGPALGPNFVLPYRQYRYNELKLYGFTIYCAIDCFFKRTTWLRMGPNKNSPKIV